MIEIPVHRVPGRSCKARGRSMAVVVAHAIVDDDQGKLQSFFWTLHSGYAARRVNGGVVFMHHDVLGRVRGLEVSHLNAAKLDNRRSNLRHASRGDNMRNPLDGPQKNRRSCPYRGVTRDDASRSLRRPWRGKLVVNGRTLQTPRFATAEEARDALEALRVREWPAGEGA